MNRQRYTLKNEVGRSFSAYFEARPRGVSIGRTTTFIGGPTTSGDRFEVLVYLLVSYSCVVGRQIVAIFVRPRAYKRVRSTKKNIFHMLASSLSLSLSFPFPIAFSTKHHTRRSFSRKPKVIRELFSSWAILL